MKKVSSDLRFAVIGAGVMGGYHLKTLERMPGVKVSAIVDYDLQKAQEKAEAHNCFYTTDLSQIVGKIDAAIISTPSNTHKEVGEYLLSHGIHCLIEKPLATTEDECKALIQASKKSGAVLLVGHVERFNPAIRKLSQTLEGLNTYSFQAQRLNYPSPRISDVDVILDLMVHDIDIILALSGKKVASVSAQSIGQRSSLADHVDALISFEDGSGATLTASRVSSARIRKLNISTNLGYFQTDYIAQQIVLAKIPESHQQYQSDQAFETIKVATALPLDLEIGHFIYLILKGGKPLISGEAALNTLKTVWALQNSLRNSHSLPISTAC